MSARTPVADPELVGRLRTDLAAAAYTVEAVGELLLSVVELAGDVRVDPEIALRQTVRT